jgi:hypothetical protein
MLDLAQESTLTFAEAARDPVLGRPVHIATIYRWANKGVRGIRLETVMVGGRRLTTQEAMTRFFDRLTQTAGSTGISSVGHTGGYQDAIRELAKDGIY